MLFNPREFLALIQDAPERTGQTTKQVAARMGEPNANHLGRQINPDDAGAKLGVEDFIYYLAVTDLQALDYIDAAFGRTAFTIPDGLLADAFMASNAAQAVQEFGRWMEKVGRYMSPESEDGAEISPGEAEDLIREGGQVIRVFAAGMAYLKTKLEQQPQGRASRAETGGRQAPPASR
jgi:hypothetical protein